MKKILVTGAAGFIGFSVCNRLLELGVEVCGVDNLNNYYDPKLKKSRLEILTNQKMPFSKIDITNNEKINELFHNFKPTIVINLAAQAGVRYSLENPHAYINSNIVGFLNILECCRKHSIGHLIYASSSSVYGLNKTFPFSEDHNVDHPVSLYAASKKSNEAMAHSYSHIFGLPTTGLRFFTVYGPWGRPDMALYIFTKNIIQGKKIPLFNHGNHSRSFTYVDDIIDGVFKSTIKIPKKNKLWSSKNPDPSSGNCPFRILNIGNNKTESLKKYLRVLEQNIGKKAKIKNLGIQRGDIVKTSADLSKISKEIGFYPKTNIETGIKKFVNWYKEYHKIK